MKRISILKIHLVMKRSGMTGGIMERSGIITTKHGVKRNEKWNYGAKRNNYNERRSETESVVK